MRPGAISLSISSDSSSNISLGSTLKSTSPRAPCSPRDADRLQQISTLSGSVSIKEDSTVDGVREERDVSKAIEPRTEQQDPQTDRSGLSPRTLFFTIPLTKKKAQQSEKEESTSQHGTANDQTDVSPDTKRSTATPEGDSQLAPSGVSSPLSTVKKFWWKSRDKSQHETTLVRQAEWLDAVKIAIEEKRNTSITCFDGTAVATLTSRAYQHATSILSTTYQLAGTPTTRPTQDADESSPAAGDEDERNFEGDDESVASVTSIELLCNWLTCRDEVSGPEPRVKKGQGTLNGISQKGLVRRKCGHRVAQGAGIDSPVARSNKPNCARMGRLAAPWSPKQSFVGAPDSLQRKISLQKKLAKSESARQARLVKSLGMVEL